MCFLCSYIYKLHIFSALIVWQYDMASPKTNTYRIVSEEDKRNTTIWERKVFTFFYYIKKYLVKLYKESKRFSYLQKQTKNKREREKRREWGSDSYWWWTNKGRPVLPSTMNISHSKKGELLKLKSSANVLPAMNNRSFSLTPISMVHNILKFPTLHPILIWFNFPLVQFWVRMSRS